MEKNVWVFKMLNFHIDLSSVSLLMWKSSNFEMVLVLIYSKQRTQDFIDYITDLREYDVPYHVRFAIDKGDTFHIHYLFDAKA